MNSSIAGMVWVQASSSHVFRRGSRFSVLAMCGWGAKFSVRSELGRAMIPEIGEEVDRQLAEQRSTADSLATRSGLMVASTAAILGFAASVTSATPLNPAGYWILGAALLVGVMVFWMGRVGAGPSASSVALATSGQILIEAKLVLIEANNGVLARTQAAFALQVVLTIAGLVILILNLWPVP